MTFLGNGNVAGKTPEELTKNFEAIEIGRTEKQLRSWLASGVHPAKAAAVANLKKH